MNETQGMKMRKVQDINEIAQTLESDPNKSYDNDKIKPDRFTLLKKSIPIIQFCLTIGLTAYGAYNYFLSLEACPPDMKIMACVTKFGHTEYNKILKHLANAGMICGIIFALMLTNILNRKHVGFITGLVFFFLCFIYDTGYDVYSHGGYNRIFLVVIGLFYSLVTYILIMTIYGIFKKTIPTLLILAIVSITGISIFKYITVGTCDYWKYGLKGTEIDNTDLSCVIPIPKICSFVIFDNLLDIPRMTNEVCTDQSRTYYNKEALLPYTKVPNATRIAYPRTEHWEMLSHTNVQSMQRNVLDLIQDVDHPDSVKWLIDNAEFVIDFNPSKGPDGKEKKFHAELKLKKKEDLEAEMLEVQKKYPYKPRFENVLVLFMDSLSRVHFKRKLKRFFNFVENKYKNDTENIAAFQFLKYHSLYPATLANMAALFYGAYPQTEAKSVLSYYKEAGYVLGSAFNLCSRETWDIEEENNNLIEQKHDHELAGIFCDPTVHSLDGPYKIMTGPYSMRRKCLWGKDTFDWAIDYAKQFFDAYRNNRKFFKLSLIDSHEGSGEMIKYADDSLVQFFEWMEKEKFLDNTLTMIMSDHGFFMPGWIYNYFNFEDYSKEMNLPVFYLLIPKSVENFKEIEKYLYSNEQNLLTTFDFNDCLEHVVIVPSESKWGKCPFQHNVRDFDRSCKWWKIYDEYCHCLDYTKKEEKEEVVVSD